MMLSIQRDDTLSNFNEHQKIIHFAPEPILEKLFRIKWRNYMTADLYRAADLKLNLESLAIESNSVDIIIANHVLEHVDDEKAVRELNRVLTENGLLICMVPIIEGWESTYENYRVESKKDRELHFGQYDHVRCYGKDFRDRVEQGGFKLIKEVTAEGEDVVKYSLIRGEKVFVFLKNTRQF